MSKCMSFKYYGKMCCFVVKLLKSAPVNELFSLF